MNILFNPLDTLFFKDGKPFSMGSETWADGNLLPNPSVLYGAIKSVYYSSHPEELQKVVENKMDPAADKIEIKSIYYKLGGNTYFPLPLDVVEIKNKDFQVKNREKIKKRYSVIKLTKADFEFATEINKVNYFSLNEEVENIEGGFFNNVELKKYLTELSQSFTVIRLSDYILSEPKVGIGRENLTRTTAEGKLYRVDMKRYNDAKNNYFRFGVETEGIDSLDISFAKLGAENKITEIEIDSEKPEIDIIDDLNIGSTFKVYLSTPAIFEKGWLPSWIDEKTFEGEINGIKLKLISAFIGKPLNIGGFDMANNKPKPMKKAVPAGSVYYFELLTEDKNSLPQIFHSKSISEFGTSKMGYGITYLGVLK